MDRRIFLAGFGSAGLVALAGCGASEPKALLHLPEPVQVTKTPFAISDGITGLATFSAHVMVLSRRDYPTKPSDVLSGVSPTDLAVAWGDAALEPAREAVEIRQADRRYYWRARKSDADIPGVGNFTRLSGNWHMFPSDDATAAALKSIEAGDIVEMEGDLVEVIFQNGSWYRSSLSREDTGDGACEIIRLRSIRRA